MMAGAYDPVEDVLKVNSVQKKWRCTFNGTALDATQWDVTSSGGASYAIANGSLTISSGTTLDAAVTLVSREVFTIPFRTMLGFSMSQRIAGHTVFVEMVSVDPETRQPDEMHIASWRLDGTAAATGIYEVASNASPRLMSTASTITSTAKGTSEMTGTALEIELFADEAWFHSRALDSVNIRSASYCRTTQLPDPNRLYKLRLRVVNRQMVDAITAIAAHTDTSIKLTRATHGLTTGDSVTVTNLAGLAGVSFPWTGTVTVIDASNFTLNGTAGFTGSWINTGWTQFTRNVAPASSTSVQFLFASVLDYAELTAEITAGRGNSSAGQGLYANCNILSVTPNINIVSAYVHDQAGANPLITGTLRSALPTTGTTGRPGATMMTLVGAQVTRPFSIPELDWSYAGPLAGLTTAADTAAKAAAGAGLRNYVTALQVQNTSGTASEFQIKDGAATVLWRCLLPANSSFLDITFPSPLKGTANTALNIQAVTAGSVVVANLQGYAAP